MRRAVRNALLVIALGACGLGAVQAQPEHEPATAQEHAAGEHGAGPEHAAGIDLKTLALQLINFAVLVFILARFGGPAINKALRARHDQLKTDLDEAARLRSDAEERFRAHEQRLANLEREIQTMLASIRQEAEQEKARIIASAEEKARRIQDETRFALDQQIKEAELNFRAEVAQAAVKVADELLRRSVTASDEQRLAQSFVAELAAGRPHDKVPPRGTSQEEVAG
jgi:F-type H+-transporting ATPase subunit b